MNMPDTLLQQAPEMLQGIRVYDASMGLAGPHCASLLALAGAEVIKVEPPQGDSSRGMGMNRAQVFFRVQMPIALPVILTGVRIVAVQTVGMAMVAALIGAGGLGAIMFQGLLSSALDLVLLGVIPAVLMAVVVDSVFKFAVSILETTRR